MDIRTTALFITTAGLLAVSYLLVDSRKSVQLQQSRVNEQLQRIEGEMKGLKELVSTQAHNDQVSPTIGTMDVISGDLRERLAALENQMDALAPRGTYAKEAPENAIHSFLQAFGQESAEIAQAPPPKTLKNTFASDAGQSEWGALTASRVTEEFYSEPYFAQFGGNMVTECRSSTCKVEWVVPTEAASDTAFAMAKMELMAVAARDNQQISQLHTESRTENDQIVVSVYLKN
jgi:hypothetical protein